MSQLDIDWSAAPEWANWAAQDADGRVWVYEHRPSARAILEAWDERSTNGRVDCVSAISPTSVIWTATLTQRPQPVTIHQDNDGAGMLRAQIGHLLEDMPAEQLDALYAHVRQQFDAAKFDELNRHLDKPFGEVPREWQLKAFEAFLDGHTVSQQCEADGWYVIRAPQWLRDTKYRIYPKQS